MSLLHVKEPSPPMVTSCRSKEIRGKSCTNTNSRLFEVKALKDKSGKVISWEIMCPICGTIWYKDILKERNIPTKYRKTLDS